MFNGNCGVRQADEGAARRREPESASTIVSGARSSVYASARPSSSTCTTSVHIGIESQRQRHPPEPEMGDIEADSEADCILDR